MAGNRSAIQEIDRLRKELRHHEYQYYVLDDPEISDANFDKLMERLKQIEEENPKLRTADSPTQRVGGTPREGFTQVRHSTPMVSLDNAFSFEALGEFDRRVRELTGRVRAPRATVPTVAFCDRPEAGVREQLGVLDGERAEARVRIDHSRREELEDGPAQPVHLLVGHERRAASGSESLGKGRRVEQRAGLR